MAMTEVSFTRDQCPDIRRFTLHASDADTATQVNIPQYAKLVTIRPEGNKVRMSLTTSSDDIHDDYIKLSADTGSEFSMFTGHRMGTQVTKIYIANKAATTSTVVSVLIEAGENPTQ
tara:strand:- start:39 stop:389 length:351 start_codon:yes stop_codon:yes gene_type:complete